MRFLSCLVLMSLLLLAIPHPATAGGEPPGEIKKAAEDTLDAHIKKVPFDEHVHNLGFDNQSDVDDAQLEVGFEIFTINPQVLLDESAPHEFNSVVIPTGEWGFLVCANGQAKSLVQVRYRDGKWRFARIGSAVLAREMKGILAAWPPSSGFNYKVIQVPEISSTLILVCRSGEDIGIIAISSLIQKKGRAAGKFTADDLQDPKEVLSSISPIFRKNVEHWKEQYKYKMGVENN